MYYEVNVEKGQRGENEILLWGKRKEGKVNTVVTCS
jgi:hypothetical protein